MPFIDFLFGKPIASDRDRKERVGPASGIAVFGLDALGSAVYGPEAALTILIPLGIAGVHYLIPLSGGIIALLGILYFSYTQTIQAYPRGAGSYTVASENLGPFCGLLAAAAMMVDYVLVSAVGIAAGIGALVSAFPGLYPYTLLLCLITLGILTVVNLRGVRDSGTAFMIPTYAFIACILTVLALGIWDSTLSGGHPVPAVPPPPPGPAAESAGIWILLRAFSNGCTAMTGVEAISNGVAAFQEPRTKTARLTLTIIVGLLMSFLAGIAYLCSAYGIGATAPGVMGYESVLSQLVAAVAGKGFFYYLSIGAILAVLALQANTAFAAFPRLCVSIAHDGFLPHPFANRGRRLVYSHGIYVLVILTGFILIIFEGVVDRLIPLFAIGAFMAFTLSQAGMVEYWRRRQEPHFHNMLLNGIGATATSATLLVVTVSKFKEGAWITLILIPGLIILMYKIRQHYTRIAREISATPELLAQNVRPPLVVVPIEDWNRLAQKALHFAISLSPDVVAVHICSDHEKKGALSQKWKEYVEAASLEAGVPPPRLTTINSPYRLVITPIINYILELERSHPDRQVAVLVPKLVERRWFQRFLHNHRGELLSALLLRRGERRIVIVNVPWYLAES